MVQKKEKHRKVQKRKKSVISLGDKPLKDYFTRTTKF